VHRLAFEERHPLRDTMFLDQVRELQQQVAPQLRMGQLPTAEADRDLDPVAVLEELDGAMDLGLEVARADLR
jgi:hypothetical protein